MGAQVLHLQHILAICEPHPLGKFFVVIHSRFAGKKIAYNQRDAPWATYTLDIGFSVMGIWPDFSDRTDINAACRSKRGSATNVPPSDPQVCLYAFIPW